jgi:hypothetical protein
MGQMMTLAQVVDRLAEFDTADTIYASEPWLPSSPAVVAPEPAPGALPDIATNSGMTYFLEVNIAAEFLEDWIAGKGEAPSPSAACQRLIEYAVNDAYGS